jgi:hypothetical protein
MIKAKSNIVYADYNFCREFFLYIGDQAKQISRNIRFGVVLQMQTVIQDIVMDQVMEYIIDNIGAVPHK